MGLMARSQYLGVIWYSRDRISSNSSSNGRLTSNSAFNFFFFLIEWMTCLVLNNFLVVYAVLFNYIMILHPNNLVGVCTVWNTDRSEPKLKIHSIPNRIENFDFVFSFYFSKISIFGSVSVLGFGLPNQTEYRFSFSSFF